jgi:hypothetical protein
MISLKPELKIEGITKAVGASIIMGEEEEFTMRFLSTDGRVETVSNEVIAGEYYAVTLNHSKVAPSFVQKRIDNIRNTRSLFESEEYDQITLDDIIGEVLYTYGLIYFSELDIFNSINTRTLEIASSRFPSESLVFHGLDISYYFSIPYSARPGSIHIDIDRDVNVAFPIDGDSSKRKTYISLAGAMASFLEHGIFEQIYQAEGMSAVKALIIANNNGIPVYEIHRNNINEIVPLLQVPHEVKLDIINNINAGNTVAIPKTGIDYMGWNGVGYIINDPATGSAGYMISGGLAGGELLGSPADSGGILSLISSFFVSPAYAANVEDLKQFSALANHPLSDWETAFLVCSVGFMISGTGMFIATKLVVEYVIAIIFPYSLLLGLMGFIIYIAVMAALIATFVWYMNNVCFAVSPLSNKQARVILKDLTLRYLRIPSLI